jgi:hypothetical protein
MVQKATIAVLLAVLLALPVSAGPPTGPLPPGRAAGARSAQLSNNETIFIGAAVLVLGVGLYLAGGSYNIAGSASGSSSSGGGTTTLPPTTTTTTTTTTTR